MWKLESKGAVQIAVFSGKCERAGSRKLVVSDTRCGAVAARSRRVVAWHAVQ